MENLRIKQMQNTWVSSLDEKDWTLQSVTWCESWMWA